MARRLDVRRLALPGCTTQGCGKFRVRVSRRGDGVHSAGLPASCAERRHLKKPEDIASGPQPERPWTQATTGPALACSLGLLFMAHHSGSEIVVSTGFHAAIFCQ